MKKKAMAVMATLFTFLMIVTAFASGSTNAIDTLAGTMTTEINNIVPQIITAVAAVVGAIAPHAMQLAGIIMVVVLILGTFRRLLGR